MNSILLVRHHRPDWLRPAAAQAVGQHICKSAEGLQKHIIHGIANPDEPNDLGKRMESFDTLEYDQFLIGITSWTV